MSSVEAHELPAVDVILKLLSSPEYWFAIVFSGLVIGVAAIYGAEFLRSALSLVSARVRQSRNRSEERRKADLAMLVARPDLLVIEYVRVVFFFVIGIAAIPLAFLGASVERPVESRTRR